MKMRCKVTTILRDKKNRVVEVKVGEALVIKSVYDEKQIGPLGFYERDRSVIIQYDPARVHCFYGGDEYWVNLDVILLAFDEVKETV